MLNHTAELGPAVPQLPVKDVEEAQKYYKTVLGFEILWTYPDKSIGAVRRGGSTVFFSKANAEITPNVHWIFTDDVDETYLELKDRGADIIEDIESKPWKIRQFTIRDLDGHIFYIHHDI